MWWLEDRGDTCRILERIGEKKVEGLLLTLAHTDLWFGVVDGVVPRGQNLYQRGRYLGSAITKAESLSVMSNTQTFPLTGLSTFGLSMKAAN